MAINALSNALDAFVARPGLSEFTRMKYEYRLRPFVLLKQEFKPGQITTDDLERYIYAQDPLKDASKSIIRSCFHAFFNYCISQGWSETNPAKALPRWRETPRRVYIPNEAEVKLALSEAFSMCLKGDIVELRNGLIFTLAVMSGNRRGELRNLPLDDLLEAMEVPETVGDYTVYRVYTNGKTGEAILRFTNAHLVYIQKYLRFRPNLGCTAVFVNLNPWHKRYGQQLSLTALDRIRRQVCKRAGVPSITYQQLRRRLATIIARSEGVDVAAHALNHSPHSGDRVIRLFYYDPDLAKVDEATAAAFYQEEM